MLLEDYNYFINKAVQQYMNTVYNRFDINQQSNDDLRVLTTTKAYNVVNDNRVELPEDYVHLLNCIVTIAPTSIGGCRNSQAFETAAKRITSDRYAGILNNYYLKPTPKRPYYMLKSSNSRVESPAFVVDLINGDRVANKSNTFDSILEIKCGNGTVSKISIDYVRAPQKIELTDDQITNLINNYHSRYHKHPNLELITTANEEIMISKYSIHKTYNDNNLYLRDIYHNLYKIKEKHNVTEISLYDMEFAPYNKKEFDKKNQGIYDPRYLQYSKMIANSDGLIIAAPFWDMSFPGQLKIFLEGVSLFDVMFVSDDKRCHGIAKCPFMTLITTRGMNISIGDKLEQGTPYLKALCWLWGIKDFYCIDGKNFDYINQTQIEEEITKAIEKGVKLFDEIL